MMIRDAVRQTPLEPMVKWLGAQARHYRRPRMARQNAQYDRQTAEIVRRVPGNHLDVGCHRGSVLREMIDASPHGCHCAFEPLPHLASALRENFPTVDVFEVALSDRPGETTFHYVRNFPGRSGIRQRPHYPGTPDFEVLTVRTDTIDNLVHHPVQMIKIDVEGGELDVLRGARRTLRDNRPCVVFEHGSAGAQAYGGTSGDIFDVLEECGLRVFLLHRWLQGGGPLSRRAFLKHGAVGPHWYFLAAP